MDDKVMLIIKSGQIGNKKLLFKYSYIIYDTDVTAVVILYSTM